MKKRSSSNDTKKIIFCLLILALPIAHFCIFYLGVNFNLILMAFQDYDNGTYTLIGLENFKEVFRLLFREPELSHAFVNSMIVCISVVFIGTTISLIFSSYIYKKRFLSGFFRVLLFLPHVISIVVLVEIFRNIGDSVLPDFMMDMFEMDIGKMSNKQNIFVYILGFALVTSLGTTVLMYSGAMSGISDSIVDACKIDGFSTVKEFIYITVPMIYPTVVTFLVVSVATFFTNQMHLFIFFGGGAEAENVTYGYYLFSKVALAESYNEYPVLSAMGVTFSLIIIPITLLVRKLLNKFGPSTD